MVPDIEAAAVVAARAERPRRPKATDQHLRVRFNVLPDEEALRRLPSIEAEPLPPPEPGGEDEGVYAPYINGAGVGLTGELKALQGRSLHRGDLLKMEIRAQGKPARIRCLGQVSWLRINRNAGLFRAGVCFVGVDPRDLSPG